MAGLGRRTFAPGEVLTASNVMGYLQDQAVMKFAGTAARGSAIGTAVAEGMVSYLADTNAVEVYDGSDWFSLGPSGRILQVVTGETTTEVINGSSTYVDSGLSATITPTRSTSKIIVIVHQNGIQKTNANSTNSMNIRLNVRSGAILKLFGFAIGITNTTIALASSTASLTFVDTPGSTSALTYKTQFNSTFNTNSVSVQSGSPSSTITLIEVAS